MGAGVGFALGALLGAALGVGLGLAWTAVFETSCLEGDCRLTVFFAFMPIGALIGGAAGATMPAVLRGRRRKAQIAP